MCTTVQTLKFNFLSENTAVPCAFMTNESKFVEVFDNSSNIFAMCQACSCCQDNVLLWLSTQVFACTMFELAICF